MNVLDAVSNDTLTEQKMRLVEAMRRYQSSHTPPVDDKNCVMVLDWAHVLDKYTIGFVNEHLTRLTYKAGWFSQSPPRPVKPVKPVSSPPIILNNRVMNDRFLEEVGLIYNVLIQNDMDEEFIIVVDPFRNAYSIERSVPLDFKNFEKWTMFADTFCHVNSYNAPLDDPYSEDILEYMAFRYFSGILCEMIEFVINYGTDQEFIKLFTRMSNEVLEYFMRYDWILDETEDFPEKRMILLREIQNRGMNTPKEYKL